MNNCVGDYQGHRPGGIATDFSECFDMLDRHITILIAITRCRQKDGRLTRGELAHSAMLWSSIHNHRDILPHHLR